VGLSRDSGDCSDRICPFEFAWVDTPTMDGRFHTYSECSGRGICDRSNGLCECFDGYEGKGCKRTTCPNMCSGHGTCEYIEDLPFGVVWDRYGITVDGWNGNGTLDDFKTDPSLRRYYGWDKGKMRGCRCDPQYGDVDCSKRMCPYGTDVLSVRENLLLDEKAQVQTIVFHNGSLYTKSNYTFAVKFVSRLNESFVTYPIQFKPLIEDQDEFRVRVHEALMSLPNRVIDGCSVNVKFQNASIQIRIALTGDAVQGPQNLLEVIDWRCGSGCTPKTTGLKNMAVSVWGASGQIQLGDKVIEAEASDLNSYECGRRGKCDYGSGLCACFEGYTGENCNTQTTLV